MLRHLTLVCLLSVASICFAAEPVRSPTLNLTTEDYPPFNMIAPKTGVISGISTEKVVELMRRAGETYVIAGYPWARAFQMGLKEENTCVFSTTRTPEREAKFKWVGPLVKNNWFIFARANDPRAPKTLEELRPYIVGGYRNDAVAEFLAARGFKIELANKDSDNPRKLLHNRFDFWATGELLGIAILKQQGLSEQIVPLFEFHQTELYLACNLGMEQSRIDRFSQILREMEKDGTAAAIEHKYK
ncbi:ABC transporter substrate-binding protein [Undibacterium sp. Jales W-56]|uniref:substrate-binding periplasmic protein n=1 Tax=Undibacterium sp. Jales W-56 TaxID=2897325 RepID=UPI0021CF4B07|nr:ABC transporter substrate-binding protein [Undibacterium sp. Jales W-56]MCU6434395.1 ABC transporter substrate-binding protein [Undibacterium sp. Jales W-56]